MALGDEKTDNTHDFFLPQQARNRREDVQNLSIRDCAGFWGTYGKLACFCSREGYVTVRATHKPQTCQAHATISE